MISLDEAMERSAAFLDKEIERHLAQYEARLRRDIEATGPEDEEALDQVPDPDSPWRRCTIEEAIMLEEQRLLEWRKDNLAKLRVELVKFILNPKA